MNFTVKSRTDLPPDPKDKYATIVAAFTALTGDDVLQITPDTPVTGRGAGGRPSPTRSSSREAKCARIDA